LATANVSGDETEIHTRQTPFYSEPVGRAASQGWARCCLLPALLPIQAGVHASKAISPDIYVGLNILSSEYQLHACGKNFPAVSVVNGEVFQGAVETLYAKQAAEHVARHTTGVWRVDNQLRQRARGFPGDNVVADKIRDVFRRDAEIDERMIEVAVTEHHARLSGTVETMGQKIRAANIASPIRGVLALDNQIAVKKRPL
jgi:hypothetical protein